MKTGVSTGLTTGMHPHTSMGFNRRLGGILVWLVKPVVKPVETQFLLGFSLPVYQFTGGV